MRYTKKDILEMVEEEDVEFVRLQFTDLFGNMKNVAITASHLKKALDNKVMFDGSSAEGFVRVEESDMYLYPDYGTFATFPWRPQQGKVARLICDVYRPDGTCYEGDPRYILKKVVSEAAALGYTFNVGPECEFFLYHVDDDGMPTTITHEQAGYFDMGPLDFGENARRDMVLTLEDMGFEVESSHPENAPAQQRLISNMTRRCRQQIILAHLNLWSKLSRSAMVFMQPLCQSRKMVWMVPACILTCLCPVTAETFSRTAMILTD